MQFYSPILFYQEEKMISLKTSSLSLILTLCTTAHVTASEEVIVQRSPGGHFTVASPHQSPVRQTRTEEPIKTDPLKITGPRDARALDQLRVTKSREIYLNGVYKVVEEAGEYVNDGPLTISPETINPEVEVLSLKVCGLAPDQIQGIGGFKKLRMLILDCNGRLKDGILSIVSLKTLTSLSLFSTGLTNAGLRGVLTLPNLVELDIRQNKEVTDEVANELLEETKLKMLRTYSTGLSENVQQQLAYKYKLIKH